MATAIKDLRGRKEIGLDVETTLQDPPRLCTVQVANRTKNYVFDALTLSDLTPIFRILEDPRIIKIIHYARFERGVFANLGVRIHSVFDTFEISRKLRGKKDRHYHSLASVCRRELKRSLNKVYQKSVWSRRPLTAGQLRYAALDAEIMLLLYDIFKAEIDRLNLSI